MSPLFDKKPKPPPQPVDQSSFRDSLKDAVAMLKVQQQNLDRIYNRIRSRDEQLFKEVEKALLDKDNARALVYANEVAQVRKMGKIVLSNKLALERVVLRLEDTIDFKETLKILGPVVNVVNKVGNEIRNVAPQVADSLRQAEDMMSRVLIQAGEVSGYEPYVSADSEADQILKEASLLASQKMKSAFPDIPDSLKQQLEEPGSRQNQL
ncbi:MAG: Snf7 family protein [Thermoproteota archaeon]